MDKIEDLDTRDQMELRKLLALDPVELNPTQASHLRARRSYLTASEKYKYSGVLYFSRPSLVHELNSVKRFFIKYSKQFIASLIIALATFWILKLFGMK